MRKVIKMSNFHLNKINDYFISNIKPFFIELSKSINFQLLAKKPIKTLLNNPISSFMSNQTFIENSSIFHLFLIYLNQVLSKSANDSILLKLMISKHIILSQLKYNFSNDA